MLLEMGNGWTGLGHGSSLVPVEQADLTAATELFRFRRLQASLTVSAQTLGYGQGWVKTLGKR